MTEEKNEAVNAEQNEAANAEKKEVKNVQIDNFLYMLDEDTGVITVYAVSKQWYIGYAPGTMGHTLLYSCVFGEERTEDDLNAAVAFVTSVYCVSNIVDADVTEDILKIVDHYMKTRESEEVTDEENKKIIDEVKTKEEVNKEISENV